MKFVLTTELGRLAKWLRILGFDALYIKKGSRAELIIRSLREERIILTRDSRMSQVSGVRLLRIRYDGVREQLKQVLDELKIGPQAATLFSRCVICNKELEPVEKDKIKGKVPEYVYKSQGDFVICPECGRVYWHGTHWGNVRQLLDEVKGI